MAERDLGGPALQRTGPQGAHDVPGNIGPAAGGVIQGPGPRAGPKLERVEFPAFAFSELARRQEHRKQDHHHHHPIQSQVQDLRLRKRQTRVCAYLNSV